MFHSLLLMPYKETQEHRAQFQCPPPELIGNKEEYKVEQIINHRHHGKWHQLQYLICWKGYSAADDTWEPTDQVHADDLARKYHQKHPLSGGKYKMTKKTWVKAISLTTPQTTTCPLLAPLTSLLPPPQASPSTQQLLERPHLAPGTPKPWYSITKSPFTSQTRWWLSWTNSVCSACLLELSALLLKGTTVTAKVLACNTRLGST